MNKQLVVVSPYRGSEDGSVAPRVVPACSTCRFRLGIHPEEWSCGAYAGARTSAVQEFLKGGECDRWRQRSPRRSVFRWLWDLLFAWSPKSENP